MNKKKAIIRTIKKSNKARKEENASAHNKYMKSSGQDCPFCPPWKGDNQVMKMNKKHGTKKPKYKNKRS